MSRAALRRWAAVTGFRFDDKAEIFRTDVPDGMHDDARPDYGTPCQGCYGCWVPDHELAELALSYFAFDLQWSDRKLAKLFDLDKCDVRAHREGRFDRCRCMDSYFLKVSMEEFCQMMGRTQ